MKTFKEYRDNPDWCPNCDSGDITGKFEVRIVETQALLEITCEDCGMKWDHVFDFASYEVTKSPHEGDFSDKETVEEETFLEERSQAKAINEGEI